VRAPRPELIGLIILAAVLNLWALSRNGWANTYYAAAVRSMSSSWHNFLFASLDPSGVMTVDKPPLALWVQALSVRVFGYDSLSILVPQALMGVGSVVLLYDLVRRRFGRVGGFVGGLALAVTPITVAISRHNNPDALLVLCCVGALWCTVRALEGGRTRWLVAAGVLVGLGFETKMGVALTVVPGIVLAWLWISPAGRGRLHAVGQLLWGGAAMVIVGGAWPALVQLTPAGDRPWISGTSDNSVFSLMFEYNGLGRVDGQSGGPGGAGGGNVFGGSTGPFRLLNSALGGQAGWLLGFAIVAGLAILAGSRLRRADKRCGWLIAVGGAFLTTAVLFSVASGIFHPYYVSLLAPFAAALVGAGAGQLLEGGLLTRVFAPLAVAGGVVTELVVRGDYPGQLSWLPPLLIVVGVLAALALVAFKERIVRLAALGGALAALLIAPTAWAFDTLGYATSSTFPSGGPASAEAMGGPGGGFGGAGGRPRGNFGGGGTGAGAGAVPQLFGTGGGEGPPGTSSGAGGGRGGGGFAGAPGAGAPGAGAAGGGAPGGAFGGGESLKSVLSYVNKHGGGMVAVSSQSSAATAIISSDAKVAGIGGFSGRESDVSVSWLAQEVSVGKIRWVVGEGGSGAAATAGGAAVRGGATATGGAFGGQGRGGFGGGLPGDTRTGSKTAMAAVAKACTKVTLPGRSGSSEGTLYDCRGRSAELAKA
jgi:4-amino-4-deoxy-L-arabinose transferase-like glycosyltransferase